MEAPLAFDGMDDLIAAMEVGGCPPLPLPGVDEPLRPAEYVRIVLGGYRDRGFDFDTAYAAAINRLQPSQEGGVIDADLARTLREERALLEEERPIWQAAYEQRPVTNIDRRARSSALNTRLHGPVTGSRKSRRRREAA